MSRRKLGFSAIELIVAISIVGLLLSLSLVSIFNAREHSRTLSCVNNSRNWSTALWEYEGTFRAFPPGYSKPFEFRQSGINGPKFTGPAVFLIEYLEGNEGIKDIKWNSVASPMETNYYGHLPVSGVFRCPSDSNVQNNSLSYVVNAGVFSFMKDKANARVKTIDLYGAFDMMTPLSTNAFHDGLSTTIFFSEKRVGSQVTHGALIDSVGDATTDFADAGSSSPAPELSNRWMNHCVAARIHASRFYLSQGRNWISGFDSNYNHISSPNQFYYECGSDSSNVANGVRCASSYHNQTVTVAFGDGRVVSLNDDIDLLIWRSFGTRSGDLSTPTYRVED